MLSCSGSPPVRATLHNVEVPRWSEANTSSRSSGVHDTPRTEECKYVNAFDFPPATLATYTSFDRKPGPLMNASSLPSGENARLIRKEPGVSILDSRRSPLSAEM